jgi:DNA-binding transcriptional LysR family regulator
VIFSIYECYQSVFQSLIFNMKESAKALDLNAVQAFVFTAELQSFTRAAEALGTTQSAISLKLRQLEKHLGRRLLERTPRRVRLSAEGATFMQAARNLLGAHERAIASFSSTRRHLVVGVSHLIVGSELPALLRRMRDHDPNLLLDLRVAGSRDIAQAYEENLLDAALVVEPRGRHSKGEVVFVEQFGWIAAADWKHRAGEPLPLSTQGDSCAIRNAAVRALDGRGTPWTEVFIGKGAALVGSAAAAGLAVAVMARRCAPPGTLDIGHSLSLPELPTYDVVLYCGLNDPRSRASLRTLAAAFRNLAQR